MASKHYADEYLSSPFKCKNSHCSSVVQNTHTHTHTHTCIHTHKNTNQIAKSYTPTKGMMEHLRSVKELYFNSHLTGRICLFFGCFFAIVHTTSLFLSPFLGLAVRNHCRLKLKLKRKRKSHRLHPRSFCQLVHTFSELVYISRIHFPRIRARRERERERERERGRERTTCKKRAHMSIFMPKRNSISKEVSNIQKQRD